MKVGGGLHGYKYAYAHISYYAKREGRGEGGWRSPSTFFLRICACASLASLAEGARPTSARAAAA